MERREGDQIKCLRGGEKSRRSDKVFEGWREERRSDKVFEGWREEQEVR